MADETPAHLFRMPNARCWTSIITINRQPQTSSVRSKMHGSSCTEMSVTFQRGLMLINMLPLANQYHLRCCCVYCHTAIAPLTWTFMDLVTPNIGICGDQIANLIGCASSYNQGEMFHQEMYVWRCPHLYAHVHELQKRSRNPVLLVSKEKDACPWELIGLEAD